MIKSTSFDKNLYDKVKLIINIHKHLTNLTNDNFDYTLSQILKNEELINTKIGVSILIRCFNDIVNFRPKNIETIVAFILFINKKEIKNSMFDLFNKKVVEIIHTKEKLTSSDLFYLRLLYNNEIFKIDSIINEIDLILNSKDDA